MWKNKMALKTNRVHNPLNDNELCGAPPVTSNIWINQKRPQKSRDSVRKLSFVEKWKAFVENEWLFQKELH
jgi:hypothetical protein